MDSHWTLPPPKTLLSWSRFLRPEEEIFAFDPVRRVSFRRQDWWAHLRSKKVAVGWTCAWIMCMFDVALSENKAPQKSNGLLSCSSLKDFIRTMLHFCWGMLGYTPFSDRAMFSKITRSFGSFIPPHYPGIAKNKWLRLVNHHCPTLSLLDPIRMTIIGSNPSLEKPACADGEVWSTCLFFLVCFWNVWLGRAQFSYWFIQPKMQHLPVINRHEHEKAHNMVICSYAYHIISDIRVIYIYTLLNITYYIHVLINIYIYMWYMIHIYIYILNTIYIHTPVFHLLILYTDPPLVPWSWGLQTSILMDAPVLDLVEEADRSTLQATQGPFRCALLEDDFCFGDEMIFHW